MSFSFPFTFRFTVPGLPNPFYSYPYSSDPAAAAGATVVKRARAIEQQRSQRRKRDFDSSFPDTHIKRPSGPLPPPLVRKRGWVPTTFTHSEAEVVPESPTGIFHSEPTYDGNPCGEFCGSNDSEEVELDLPPSKRRKGITGTVVSSAFNTLLVGAAVGLTMYRMWRDRGKEIEQSPPPPYQEEWTPPNVQAQELPPKASAGQPAVPSENRTHASVIHYKKVAPSTRRTQKPTKRVVTVRRDASPRKPRAARTVPHVAETNTQINEGHDEMDWIGDQLSKLIEEGKRALGAEIVVSSEAPEDEVDDGTGDWTEDEEASASFAFESRRSLLGSPSKKHRFMDAYSASPSASLHATTLPQSLSRTFSNDVSSANTLSPSHTVSYLPADDEISESPSVREAMEIARASYRQRRAFNATA